MRWVYAIFALVFSAASAQQGTIVDVAKRLGATTLLQLVEDAGLTNVLSSKGNNNTRTCHLFVCSAASLFKRKTTSNVYISTLKFFSKFFHYNFKNQCNVLQTWRDPWTDFAPCAGPFTVFAPTNDAFAALPADIIQKLKSDKKLLTSVLLAHVANKTTSSKTFKDDELLASMNTDAKIRINIYLPRYVRVRQNLKYYDNKLN